MSHASVVNGVKRSRVYFGMQAAAGAAWWAAVLMSDDVRRWTLGGWDHLVLLVPDVLLFVVGSGVVAVTANRIAGVVVAVWTVLITAGLAVYALVERVAGWGVVAMVCASVGSVVAATTIWMGRLPLEWFFVGPFEFRVAREASSARHLRRSLAQLVVFWTTFFVIIPIVLVLVENRLHLRWPYLQADGWVFVALVLCVGGSAVGLWSCITMSVAGEGTPLPAETARRLVVSGPYRYVRNPMALAGAIQTVGVGLLFGSWMVVAIAFAGAIVWNTMIRPSEEADLADRFGDSYQRYAQHVRCWIPRKPWPSLQK